MVPTYYDYKSPSSTGLAPQEQEPARADSVNMVAGGTNAWQPLTNVTEFEGKPILVPVNRQEPTGTAPQVSRLARRIHGWSWQAVGFLAQSGILVLSLIASIVSRRNGHWCCLCYPVGPEAASADFDDRRDHVFLHQSHTLPPQLIDAPSPSIMCD